MRTNPDYTKCKFWLTYTRGLLEKFNGTWEAARAHAKASGKSLFSGHETEEERAEILAGLPYA